MMRHRRLLTPLLSLLVPSLSPAAPAAPQPADGRVKVFVLAGQSNMVGFGQVAGQQPGTMETCVKNHPARYGHLVDANGAPTVRDDVWCVDLSSPDSPRQGWLTTGFGASQDHIGPEYGFGLQLGDYFADPVVLIKCAWGGRSLYQHFLPPSAADYPPPEKDGDTGFQYAETIRITKHVMAELDRYFPHHPGQGQTLVGFGWHQGWNDRINQQAVDAYERHLVHLIKDLRRDLDVAALPFVIANSGFDGWEIPARYRAKVEKHLAAQLAVGDFAKYPAFQGNVATVETRDFFRPSEQSPSRQAFHWSRNWETFYLIGEHLGQAMIRLLEQAPR